MHHQEIILRSSSGEISRTVWFALNSEVNPQRLCVFLDAEYYLERMDTVSVLDELQATGAIPPVACLFVSHMDGAARHFDYTCNERYSRFIVEDVVNWARGRCGSLAGTGHLICGLSLSGLASAFLASDWPDIFAGALCQSGSFWWNEEWLTNHIASLGRTQGAFWLSVGD